MKTSILIFAVLIASTRMSAFGFHPISYSETIKSSDFVAIVRPEETKVLANGSAPEPLTESEVGTEEWVQTSITVLAVLKGGSASPKITILHKRIKEGVFASASGFVSFKSESYNPTFLVFLRAVSGKESIYVPTTGQTFAFQSIVEMKGGGVIGK